MSSIGYYGKVHRGFPFSFFRSKGDLHIDQIYPIKSHIYKVIADDATYILKRYSNKSVVQQQWDFFSEIELTSIVSFVPFPSGKRYICDEERGIYTLAPCMNGSSLSYTNKKDRIEAHNILYQFQQSARGIQLDTMIPKLPVYLKWKNRLHNFSAFRNIFDTFDHAALYRAITQKSYAILSEVKKLDWTKIEDNAVQNGMWVHGDVASHNFIRDGSQVWLIDFDLLGQSPVVYDWIQLAQRWMNDIEAKELLTYGGFQQFSEDPLWLLGVCYPSDVMREFLRFMKTCPPRSRIDDYLEKMVENWMHRESFVEQLSDMLT